jgi:RNA polymerase sigma factor (sigma-70 family)
MNGKTRKEVKAERLTQFEAIVSMYEGPLLRYAAGLLRQHDAAQNVVQDTFIRLFKYWEEELQPSPQIMTWLYRVAHNCAVDHLRREERRHLLHVRHSMESAEFVPPNRGEGFTISEKAEQAVAALKTLSLRERELVVLKVYEEKSYQEISEITGLTVSKVGYILHHAMKKLSAELNKAGET